MTHICVGKLTVLGSDNGLSPWRRQAIIWTNAGILLIGPSGANFSDILIEIHTFSFKKMHLKMSSAKWRPFCLGLNELKGQLRSFSPLGSWLKGPFTLSPSTPMSVWGPRQILAICLRAFGCRKDYILLDFHSRFYFDGHSNWLHIKWLNSNIKIFLNQYLWTKINNYE